MTYEQVIKQIKDKKKEGYRIAEVNWNTNGKWYELVIGFENPQLLEQEVPK